MHYFAPEGLPTIPKNVIFVIDKSGSMRGRKIQQVGPPGSGHGPGNLHIPHTISSGPGGTVLPPSSWEGGTQGLRLARVWAGSAPRALTMGAQGCPPSTLEPQRGPTQTPS